MSEKRFEVEFLTIQDNAPKGRLYLLHEQGGVNALCSLINGLNDKCIKLQKESEKLRQQITGLKEDVPLLLGFYRWYPFAVTKKEHQIYERLWDFVNDGDDR